MRCIKTTFVRLSYLALFCLWVGCSDSDSDGPASPVTPCDGVSCAQNATCENGTCVCATGFSSTDPATVDCTQTQPPDPCDGVSCAQNATCQNGT